MTAFFVTATGTEIGKTFLSCGIIRTLRMHRHPVDALKPVMSGFDSENMDTSDAAVLISALGRSVTLAEIERISPFRFKEPLSPDMAARREQRIIDFDELVTFCRNAIATHKGSLLIEGIGGLMVPLNDTYTVIDWIAALDIPLVLVSGSYLGAISHTITALDAIERRGLKTVSLVINESAAGPVSLDEMQATISRFAKGINIFTFPRFADCGFDHPEFQKLTDKIFAL